MLRRPVHKDAPITYEDVDLHELSTILALRRLQDQWIENTIHERDLLEAVDRLGNDSFDQTGV